MGNNSIKKIETKKLHSDEGNFSGIFISLDIYDRNGLDPFIQDVIKKFTLQKMISPPDTSILLITIIGEIKLDEFVSRWKILKDNDIIMCSIISMLTRASVVLGNPDGSFIDEQSLK